METIKNTFNQAKETVLEGSAATSKEANKQVAKDSDASLGTRATAAKDAVGDKFDEEKHSAQGEVEKQKN